MKIAAGIAPGIDMVRTNGGLSRVRRLSACAMAMLLAATGARADSGPIQIATAQDLYTALAAVGNDPSASYQLELTDDISATGQFVINGNVTIQGGNHIINMTNADRAFFIQGGTVNLQQMTITNGYAPGGAGGGDGGGGGAGLGGGILVGSGSYISGNGYAISGVSAPNVTLDQVYIQNSKAQGGNGASYSDSGSWGGGGGLGGAGGSGGGYGDNGGGAAASAIPPREAAITPAMRPAARLSITGATSVRMAVRAMMVAAAAATTAVAAGRAAAGPTVRPVAGAEREARAGKVSTRATAAQAASAAVGGRRQ